MENFPPRAKNQDVLKKDSKRDHNLLLMILLELVGYEFGIGSFT